MSGDAIPQYGEVPEGFNVLEIVEIGASKCLVMHADGLNTVGTVWVRALPFHEKDVEWCNDPECEEGEHPLTYGIGFPLTLKQIGIMIDMLIGMWWDMASEDEKAAKIAEVTSSTMGWVDGKGDAN